jgi:membrane-associated protease RseP (regulator of RpoE activity)
VLLLLSLLSGRLPFLQVLPVLFAPLGHEFLIQAGNHREWNSPPRLTPSQRGVKLLAVQPGSPVALKGLGSGWTILNVNGIEVNSRRELASALNVFPGLAEIEAISPEGVTKTVRIHQSQGKLGLIPVPDASESGPCLKIAGQGFLLRLWAKLKKKKSGA